MTTDQPARVHAWLDADRVRTASDIALGCILLLFGTVAIAGAPPTSLPRWDDVDVGFYPSVVGGLLVIVGIILSIRGSFLGRTRRTPWGLSAFITILVTVVVISISIGIVGFLVDPLGLFGFPGPGDPRLLTAAREILLGFGPPASTALTALLLVISIALVRQSRIQALSMAFLGLALATIGLEATTGVVRLTMGVEQLMVGIHPIILGLGLFIVADGLICIASPSLLLTTYARQVRGWAGPRLSPPVAFGLCIVATIVIAVACYLALQVHASMLDIGLLLVIGLFGVGCKVFGWNRLVLIVAFSRSDQLENGIRQSMMMSGGDPAIFLREPLSGTLVALTVSILLVATFLSLLRAKATSVMP